jgi:hypothetical protein
MAKVIFIVRAEIPDEDLNAVWAEPSDYLIAAYNTYYGMSDVNVHYLGGVILEDSDGDS